MDEGAAVLGVASRIEQLLGVVEAEVEFGVGVIGVLPRAKSVYGPVGHAFVACDFLFPEDLCEYALIAGQFVG